MTENTSNSLEKKLTLHASCVAFDGRAILTTGASGSGKSALALELMAFGCTLVADDRVELRRDRAGLIARAPASLPGLIEARGIGLLHAQLQQDVPVAFCVTLDHEEVQRLPPLRTVELLGHRLMSVWRVDAAYFAAALFQMLKHGRSEPL